MSTLIAATAIFVLAGAVKGVVGLGLPTIAMALLALLMPPAQAAALLIVPSFITNVWQMRPWRRLRLLLRRLAAMQMGVVLGTLGGAWAMGAPAGAWAMVSLGLALLAYAGFALSGFKLTIAAPSQKWVGLLVGTLTGVVTAATGVFVIPAVPYLQALGLEREELIQAMGLSFTVSTIALATGLHMNESYSVQAFGLSVLMLVPALFGMELGRRLRERLSPVVFRRYFLVTLILLGLHMIARETYSLLA